MRLRQHRPSSLPPRRPSQVAVVLDATAAGIREYREFIRHGNSGSMVAVVAWQFEGTKGVCRGGPVSTSRPERVVRTRYARHEPAPAQRGTHAQVQCSSA